MLIYYVFKYRRQIVAYNLKVAFPDKTEAERIQIGKAFYKNFTDNFIETIKLVSISEKEMKKRFEIDIEPIDALIEKYGNIQAVSGHYFNWEFANLGIGVRKKYIFLGVYKPLSNKVFNKFMIAVRSKFGTTLLSSSNFRDDFQKNAKGNYLFALVADQNANNTSKALWVDFFGKKVPFVKGPEKGAKLHNTPIVYAYFAKTKRGFYKCTTEIITTTPNDYKDGELTKILIKKIEDSIKQEPSNYLWSHRRWKHVYDTEKHAHLTVD